MVVANGGYPLHQNIHQAMKRLTSAEATNKDGRVIIMVAGNQTLLACSASPVALLVGLTKRRSCMEPHWDCLSAVHRDYASWITESGKTGKGKNCCWIQTLAT